MEKSADKEKKVPKTNKHFEIYLDYVKMYNVLKLKWTMQRGYSTQIQNIWLDMTRQLNGCGGPVRDVTHWKKVFTEWKSHTRRKLKHDKPLNDIEKQLVELTGLTSNPERTQTIKTYKNKSAKNKHNKENNPPIKEELLDEYAEESDNSFIEQESSSCSEDNRKLLKENVAVKEKEVINKKHHNEEKKRHQEKQTKQSSAKHLINKGSSKIRNSSEKSTQVDQGLLGIIRNNSPNMNDLGTIGVAQALQSLANAVNRYCDIVERRIF